MPVHSRGRGCYQWGEHGKIYCGAGRRVVTELHTADRVFKLCKPLVVQASMEDGCWVFSEPALGIVAADLSQAAAWAAFCEEFASIWDHVGKEKDRHLTIDARQLKRTIRNRVEDVRKTS